MESWWKLTDYVQFELVGLIIIREDIFFCGLVKRERKAEKTGNEAVGKKVSWNGRRRDEVGWKLSVSLT